MKHQSNLARRLARIDDPMRLEPKASEVVNVHVRYDFERELTFVILEPPVAQIRVYPKLAIDWDMDHS